MFRRMFSSSQRLLPCHSSVPLKPLIKKPVVRKPQTQPPHQKPVCCERCGREGHSLMHCAAKYDICGIEIEDERGY